MPNLNKYVHYACGVINFDIKTHDDLSGLMDLFVKFVDSYNNISDYFLIAHDETNVPHIHFIFYSHKQVQVMTYYNKLRNWFVDKYHATRDEKGINIDKCESINAHLKYLVHRDKESIALNKKQYSSDDFVSNQDSEYIDNLIASKKGVIDAYLLRDAVLDTTSEFDLMVKLTLPVFHRYRDEIRIIRENRAFLKLQREEERRQSKIESIENRSDLEDSTPMPWDD